MSYKLKRIVVQNLRTISNCDVDLSGYDGLIRVGGLNGNGKSTVFYIGFLCLLGLTPMQPHMTIGHKSCRYEVENGFGRFGVKFSDSKTHFYYVLNDGDSDTSSQSVNFNNCLDVIKRYIGFDYSAQFKSILNLNSKDKLMYVHTNGRNDLEFLRKYIYSEEIERVQERCIEDEKYLKSKIDEISTQVQYLYQDVGKIKSIDPKELKECINYVEEIINWQNHINSTQESLKRYTEDSLQYIKLLKERTELLNLNLDKSFTEVLTSKVEIKYLEYRKMKLKNDSLREYLKELQDLDRLKELTKTKKILVETLKVRERVEIVGNSVNELVITNIRSKSLQLKLLKENIREDLITLKLSNIKALQSKVHLLSYVKGSYGGFGYDLINFSEKYLQNSKLHLELFTKGISDVLESKANIDKLRVKLDKEIYKDGRCVLCLSPKNCDHIENLH